MNAKKVLIIDDEPDIRELLEITLQEMNIACRTAENLQKAYQLLEKDDYFLCLADMRLPDGDGIEFVKYLQAKRIELPIAIITAFGNIEGAVNALKAGAFDYVSKPINLKMLRNLVATAERLSNQSSLGLEQIPKLIGHSKAMMTLRADIKKLARSQAPVFIHGSSGVGKELVAHLIHQQGPRVTHPFIPVNCGAIPSELMESELFGHKKGSFSGAVSDHKGLFQAAHKGTLFLDEIAELPLSMQVKLLRAIQEKAVKPVGALYEEPVDVRILSASHKDLLNEIEQGHFRQDLYYRINVIEIKVADLKERKEDIPELVKNILHKLCKGNVLRSLSNEAFTKLKQYDFPGNVRELENILERAITLSEKNIIAAEDIILQPVIESTDSTNHFDTKMAKSDNKKIVLDDYLEAKQRDIIMDTLEKTKWNRTKAAKLLGISFRALRYRLKKLGIE